MGFITGAKNYKAIKDELARTGTYYTDPKLAKVLKSMLPDDLKEVYDPACGVGNLLAVFPDEVRKFGQELDPEQAEQARAELVNAEIAAGDTLKAPAFFDRKFRGIIANPPFSVKWEPKQDPRFADCGVLPPKSKADYAFILHCLYMLEDNGAAVILLPHGVLFRGQAEGAIRKWLVDNNHIEKIVAFPSGYFADTGIETFAMVLRKRRAGTAVRVENHQLGLGREVPKDEIAANDYNLNIPRYVWQDTPRERIDYAEVNKERQDLIVKCLEKDLEVQRVLCAEVTPSLGDYSGLLGRLREVLDAAAR